MSMRAKAWAALLIPPVAWFAFEQGLSAVLHADCSRRYVGIIWGLASLAACAIGLRMGWSLRTQPDALVDPWLARLGIAVAGIFSLAIAFQTLAIAIVPACVG
jgi:hypothetical protein